MLKSPTEVAAPGPLPLDSAQYAKEIDEVRRIGARDSKERSADQTAAAIFSLIKSSDLWSAAARAATAAKGTRVIENARIFALALTLLFGNDGVQFSATFGGIFGLTRSFNGFAAAEKEIEDARVWAGIHTRTADEHGTMLGHQIAELTVQRVMRPLSDGSKGQ